MTTTLVMTDRHRGSQVSLCQVGLMAILVGASGFVAKAQISGNDDFNDSSRDIGKWGTIDYPAGNGHLSETNHCLEYTVPSPDLVNGDESFRPWISNRPSNATDWEVVLDVFNKSSATLSNQVATVGIQVFNNNDREDYLYVELYALMLSELQRGFKSSLAINGVDLIGISPLGDFGINVTEGAVRLQFDANSQVFTAFYDTDGYPNGYTWHKFASFGISGSGGATTNANWGMSSNADFQVTVYGFSLGMSISNTQVYGDNFFAQTAPASPPSLEIVSLTKSVQLRWPASALGYELNGNPTLASNSWSLVTNLPTTIITTNIMQLPASSLKQFFRLQK